MLLPEDWKAELKSMAEPAHVSSSLSLSFPAQLRSTSTSKIEQYKALCVLLPESAKNQIKNDNIPISCFEQPIHCALLGTCTRVDSSPLVIPLCSSKIYSTQLSWSFLAAPINWNLIQPCSFSEFGITLFVHTIYMFLAPETQRLLQHGSLCAWHTMGI